MSSLALVQQDSSLMTPVSFYADTHSVVEATHDLFSEFYQALNNFEWSSRKNTFGGATSEIFALVRLGSTQQQRVLSKEDDFIQRAKLQPAIKTAYHCIDQLFGPNVPIELEYRSENGLLQLEWLNVTLYFQTEDDQEIDALLDKADQLYEMFEESVTSDHNKLIYFHIDVK